MPKGKATFRDFVGSLWALGRGSELKKMGAVRGELLRAVRSPATDEEAAQQIGDLVRADRPGAKATLKYVVTTRKHSRTYETDRAYRVLVAAMGGVPPEPARSEDAELFERERELVLMPLTQAFARLVSEVPELDAVRERAEQLARSPEAFWLDPQPDGNRVVVSGRHHSEAMGNANQLVGPRSNQPAGLMRSSLTLQVVSAYVTAILAGPEAARVNRALWDQEGQWPIVSWSTSIIEFG
jgi:hypothetical protein